MKDGNPGAFDVVVIGSGSAGMAAARGAAGRGLSVALVERDAYLGGECPNYACVPTKALLKAAAVYTAVEHADEYGIHLGDCTLHYGELKRFKDHIVGQTGGRRLTVESLAEDGITLVRGIATFVDAHTIMVGSHRIAARQVVLACGSVTRIPDVPGIDSVPYLTSGSALELTTQPKSVIILGGGPVGVEFAQLFSTFGADVTLIQLQDRILPRDEPETARVIAASLRATGVEILTGFQTENIEKTEAGVSVRGKTSKEVHAFDAEYLLVATGQRANVDDLALDKVGISVGDHGLDIDETLRTTAPHIWAAGDIVGKYLFTNAAHAMGQVVAHNLVETEKRVMDFRVMPRAVFTRVELASVGETEEELTKAGRDVVVGIGSIGGLSRALTDSEPEGLVKLVADAKTGEVLGGSIACVRAGEMIHEVALCMQLHASVKDLVTMIHCFPTYSEAIRIAAGDAANKLKS